MKKRLLSACAAVLTLCGAAACLPAAGTLTACALDYGPMKYKDYGDLIEILSCDKDVTELVIPEEIDGVPVTHIGRYLCSNYTALQKVILPDSVQYIADSAFSGCTNLTELELGNGLLEFNSSVFGGQFQGCTALTEVRLPATLKGVGYAVFSGCAALKNVTIEDGVGFIGTDAFRGCGALESITIPDSVTEIGYNAFYNCKNLKSAVIGNGVKTIGTNAFYDCTSLEEVTIGNSIERIMGDAFFHAAITEVYIPESAKMIEGRAFICPNLTSVTIESPACQFGAITTTFWNEQDEHGNCYYNGTIYGYTNSTAEEYAKSHGCKFISLTDGDINLDGDTGLIDAVLLARVVAGTEADWLTPQGRRHADLDGEDGLGAGDLTLLMRMLAGL